MANAENVLQLRLKRTFLPGSDQMATCGRKSCRKFLPADFAEVWSERFIQIYYYG